MKAAEGEGGKPLRVKAARLSLTRRQFLKYAGAAALVGVGGPTAYGALAEAWDYELTETVVPIKDLPERFEGFRIAQVSDVHHGRLVPIGEVRRVVALANSARADMLRRLGRTDDAAEVMDGWAVGVSDVF